MSHEQEYKMDNWWNCFTFPLTNSTQQGFQSYLYTSLQVTVAIAHRITNLHYYVKKKSVCTYIFIFKKKRPRVSPVCFL